MPAFIPFHVPCIGEEEINEVVETLRSGWLTTGPRTLQFEKEFAEYVRAPHALAVNSCTAGLHLALAALGVGAGDEVITTPLTFCATVNTILHVGATPVLADIGPDGNLDPASIEACITERTRAIMPVHLAGLPCNMDAIWDIAQRHGLLVVEDAAHAVGSLYNGVPIGGGNPAAGRYSDAVAFSFYATKNLTTGEGGMVTTHNDKLANDMRMLCLHGISTDAWNRYSEKGKWFYEVLACGYKYNMSDIQSAIGLHQLRKQERFLAKRAEYSRLFTEGFQDMAELEPPPDSSRSRHCWHLYSLRLNLENLQIDRADFIRHLNAEGIGSSVHFIPIPLHPFYAAQSGIANSKCPNAMDMYPRLISLPLYPAMTEEQVQRVIDTVKGIASRYSKVSQTSFTTI
ncbi:MAG: DegT/DnrJ/EryC1/StrS family aminotransferase [Acidobacteriota bacterium]